MKKASKYLFFILLAATLLYACKSSEQALRISLEKKEKKERIQELLQHAVLYDTFSGSGKISIKPGKKNKSSSTSTQIKIKKDQVIELSMRLPILGEVAKISITPERILIIDRFNGQYFEESMSRIQEISSFDFDFYSLQALITNQLFIAGKPVIDEKDFDSFQLIEDEFQVLLNNKDSQGINYDFTSDYTRRILNTEMYKDKSKANLLCTYRDFGLTSNNRLFPLRIDMVLNSSDDTFTLDMSLNRVDINEPFSPNTKAPEKYSRISLEQVMKLINSL